MQSPAGMLQAQCQVQIPPDLEPGAMFIAQTPDGQSLQITVPEGASPGSLVTFFYAPIQADITPTVVGQPVMYGSSLPMTVIDAAQQQDNVSSQLAWIMYFAGCLLCICCPWGCAPIFWCVIACMHYAKPKELRDRLHQERLVARISAVTAMISTIIIVIIIGVVVVPAWSKSRDASQTCMAQCRSSAEVDFDGSACDFWAGACVGQRRRRRGM